MKYVNQKREIRNGEAYCGSAVVAMLTEENPQSVADIIGDTADDMELVKYLRKKKFSVTKIVDGGNAKTKWAFIPSAQHFDAMREALDDDMIILYHFAGWDKRSSGHYALCVGYNEEGFIFYDPAGDRNEGYFNDSGVNALYDVAMLKTAGIKRLWGVA